MPTQVKKQQKWLLASVALIDAYTDFVLSRQAMNCAPTTLEFYAYTVGVFLTWIDSQGVLSPQEITARHVRHYLAQVQSRGRKDTTLHAHARAIRTLLRFWHADGYIASPVKVDMPKLLKKRLPVLTVEQLATILKACNVRDKAIVLFLVDSGLRRGEVCKLNWADVDIQSGLVRVKEGKDRKDRSAVIGERHGGRCWRTAERF